MQISVQRAQKRLVPSPGLKTGPSRASPGFCRSLPTAALPACPSVPSWPLPAHLTPRASISPLLLQSPTTVLPQPHGPARPARQRGWAQSPGLGCHSPRAEGPARAVPGSWRWVWGSGDQGYGTGWLGCCSWSFRKETEIRKAGEGNSYMGLGSRPGTVQRRASCSPESSCLSSLSPAPRAWGKPQTPPFQHNIHPPIPLQHTKPQARDYFGLLHFLCSTKLGFSAQKVTECAASLQGSGCPQGHRRPPAPPSWAPRLPATGSSSSPSTPPCGGRSLLPCSMAQQGSPAQDTPLGRFLSLPHNGGESGTRFLQTC